MKKNPSIILIGGVPGVGKTSFCFKLMKKENITHKIGTGFLREALRKVIKNKNFLRPSYNCLETFKIQSKILQPFIYKIIDRSFREGTSIIIEGTAITPLFFNHKKYKNIISEKIFLFTKNETTHFKNLKINKLHTKRKIKFSEFLKIRQIQNQALVFAKKNNWRIIKHI